MLKRVLPPAILLISVIAFWLLETLGILPNVNELMQSITQWIKSQGAYAIVAVSVMENIVGFNSYFPGSIAILGVMASTAGRPFEAVATFFLILIGQSIGLTISFLIGRLGFLRSETNELPAAGLRYSMLFPLFAHPHSSAATAFLLGSKRRSFGWLSFVLICCFIWSVFWGGVMYFGVGSLVNEIGWDYVTITFASIWVSYEVVQYLLVRSRIR